ncbi:MAG: hypothetical protein HFE83_06870 [Lachnospiraceae bacterium]|nr:hypothetical protein [Lachnospiraceae bacterium]
MVERKADAGVSAGFREALPPAAWEFGAVCPIAEDGYKWAYTVTFTGEL